MVGQHAGTDTSLADQQLPSDGAWRLRVWQRDAAGNEDPDRSADAEPLLLDTVPPDISLNPPVPSDPARIRISATDATSGVASTSVEVRRHGSDAWLPVPVTGDAGDASALLDDEHLAKGTYDIRARATDLAGNERTAVTYANGASAAITLPARVVTSLRGGKLVRHGKGPTSLASFERTWADT